MSQVDIIIPTYNRTNLLKRVLDYYQNNGSNFNFIIADSSSPGNKLRNRKIIKQYSNLKILYLDRFPQTLSQHNKFIQMVKYAKSKYCVICADDDFVVPDSIRQCANFLDKNPDYVAAHGTYIGFFLSKNFLGSTHFLWRLLYSPFSLSLSPTRRLLSHLTNYIPVIFAVRRTEAVKKIYNELSKAKIDPYLMPVYGELLPDVLTVILGKVKYLNILYAARQSFSQILNTYPSLLDAKKTGVYDKEYKKFKKSLVYNLANQRGSSGKNHGQIIDLAIEKYLKYSYQEHLLSKINNILNHSPKLISKLLSLVHAYYLFFRYRKNKLGSISSTSSRYFGKFDAIRQIVLKHSDL